MPNKVYSHTPASLTSCKFTASQRIGKFSGIPHSLSLENMRFLIVIFISILLLISCSKSNETLFGEYESEAIRFYEIPSFYISGFYGYTKGAKLALNSDNSFEYLTCVNLFSGTWEEYNDSLFLYVTENKYRIDSLNIVGFEGKFATIPDQPIKFKIEGELLVSQSVNSKGMKLMSKLRKNEP